MGFGNQNEKLNKIVLITVLLSLVFSSFASML